MYVTSNPRNLLFADVCSYHVTFCKVRLWEHFVETFLFSCFQTTLQTSYNTVQTFCEQKLSVSSRNPRTLVDKGGYRWYKPNITNMFVHDGVLVILLVWYSLVYSLVKITTENVLQSVFQYVRVPKTCFQSKQISLRVKNFYRRSHFYIGRIATKI